MSLILIPYEDVKAKRKGDVAYHPVALTTVPPVSLREHFGEMVPDTFVLGPALWKELSELVATKLDNLACYYTTQSSKRLRVFVYTAERQVTALETAVSGELDSWLTQLTAKLARGSRGCIMGIYAEGMQVSISMLMESDEQGLETAAIKVFKKHAPPRFSQADEAKRKAALLAKLEKEKGPVAADDAAKVEELLRAFAARREHELSKPLTPDARGDVDARLAALEQQLGGELPAGARAVWRTMDGAANLFFERDLLSLQQVAEEWRRLREIFDEMTMEDLQGNTQAQPGVTQQLYVCPKWIPFVELTGDCLAIDLLPGPDGHVGQVILAGRHVDTRKQIAPDMTSFLALCLEYAAGASNVLDSVFPELEE